jgi:DNA-binding transcriptional ArsR family regulator
MRKPIADPFLAISDSSRRHILHLLSEDSYTINALAENFDMSRPAVSKHIKILENAGFISIKDIGRERYCILRPDGFENLQDWINYFEDFWSEKRKKLEKLLKKREAGKS